MNQENRICKHSFTSYFCYGRFSVPTGECIECCTVISEYKYTMILMALMDKLNVIKHGDEINKINEELQRMENRIGRSEYKKLLPKAMKKKDELLKLVEGL